jgi:hypothetical protein
LSRKSPTKLFYHLREADAVTTALNADLFLSSQIRRTEYRVFQHEDNRHPLFAAIPITTSRRLCDRVNIMPEGGKTKESAKENSIPEEKSSKKTGEKIKVLIKNPYVLYGGIFGVVFALGIVVGWYFMFGSPNVSLPVPDLLKSNKISQEQIDLVEALCYNGRKAEHDGLMRNPPATALESIDFTNADNLPIWLQYYGGRAFTNDSTKEEILEEIRNYYTDLAQLAVEVAECYVRELADFPKLRENAEAALAQSQKQLADTQSYDYGYLLETDLPAEQTVKLAPNEVKRFRMRTFCIDSLANPPEPGVEYLLGGTVDEMNKADYCELLRQGQSGENMGETQRAIWELENTRAGDQVESEAAGDSTFMLEAQSSGQVGVRATSTGTITDFDVEITNYTNRQITLDTSCGYFVPIAYPERSYGDLNPGELESFYEDFKEQYEGYLNPEEEPDVQGAFTNVYIPIDINSVDLDQIDPPHPAQGGYGSQAVGTSGSMGRGTPNASDLPPLEPIVKPDPDFKILAEQNMQDSWDRFRNDPNVDTLRDMIEALDACRALECSNTQNYEDLMLFEMVDVMEQSVQDFADNPTPENMRNAMDAMRMCQAFGCNPLEAMADFQIAVMRELQRRQDEY